MPSTPPCSPARPRRSPSPAAPRSRPTAKPALPRQASPRHPPTGGLVADSVAAHLSALSRLIPRLRADPAGLSNLLSQLSWFEAEREDWRWLCEAVGGAAPTATDASVTLPPTLVAAPSRLLALPPPLLLRVLAALPVASLGAATCASVALRDLGYGGGLAAG